MKKAFNCCNWQQLCKLLRVMRITIFFLLVSLLQSYAGSSLGQTAKLNMQIKGSSIETILEKIENETDYHFFYKSKELNNEKKFDVDIHNGTVFDILNDILPKANLSYKVFDKYIAISSVPGDQPVSQSSIQQQKKVSGKVTDSSGTPLPGVTIVLKGTTTGTITDSGGNYSLISVPSDGILVFSFVGMSTQEIPVGNQTTINVKMEEESIGLDEVVAIGYGTVKKRDLTGSVSSVKSEELKVAPATNVIAALQGHVAGLDITQTSGKSGSTPDILLRGNRSLTASNDPLYIIDGIAGSITTLNPNDIESVDVLKDASSTAIYGSAGANGVIIITTKQATQGKLQIDFDCYMGVNKWPSFPHALKGDAWFNYLEAGYYAAYGSDATDQDELLTAYSMSPEQLDPYIEANKWVDWVSRTLQTGIEQNYSLSMRGGNSATQGYFSLGYNSNQGIYKNDKTDTYTMRTGVNLNLKKWLKTGIQASLSWRNKDTRNSRINKAFSTIPLGDVYDEDGNINVYPIDGNSTVSLLADDVPGVYSNNTKLLTATANPYFEVYPVKGLSFKSIVGTSYSSSRTGEYSSENTYMNLSGSGTGTKTADYSTELKYSYTWENILNYKFNLATDHEFDLTTIAEWHNSKTETSYMYNENFDYDDFLYYNMSAGDNPSVSTSYSGTKKMSFAVRANYSYKGRYLLSLSNRWDGASQLAKKWDYFPAAALGWRISDEQFMNETGSWLSNLKLRAGYGVSGNANIDPYVTSTEVESSSTTLNLGSGQVALYVPTSTVGNTSLKWEKSYNTNIGIDMGLFRNRIDMSLDLYNTDTRDVLYERPIPSSEGTYDAKTSYTVMSNIASMNNKGIELTLNTRNLETRDFKWNSALTFARNKEKVKSIDLGSDITTEDLIALNLFLGHPKNTVYGYKKLGIWQTDEADEAALYGREPGQVKIQTVADVDDDGNSDEGIHEYSADDKQILGSESPKWTMGFQNTFFWRNFDLNIFAVVRWGQLADADILGYFKYKQVNLPDSYDYWTPDNPTNDFPQPNINGNSDDVALSSLPIVNDSYIKIKNISLGYSISDNLCKRYGISRLRVYSTVSNPFIYRKNHLLDGVDPETGGSDEFPLYKQVVFGVNLSF